MGASTGPKVLVGWKRTETEHGCVLTLQLARTGSDFAEQKHLRTTFVMNERQLRSFARDLTRAANERGIELFSRPPWWRRLLRRLRDGRDATALNDGPMNRSSAA